MSGRVLCANEFSWQGPITGALYRVYCMALKYRKSLVPISQGHQSKYAKSWSWAVRESFVAKITFAHKPVEISLSFS